MKTTLFSILLILFVSELSGAWTRGQWSSAKVDEIDFLMYVPSSLADRSDPSSSRSPNRLMVNLHGCAQKAEELKAAGNWEGASEQYRMVVVLPKVPKGGVIFGCWDYYGSNHTTSNRHNGPLIKLAEALLKDPDLGIDKDEVFISGLSSGGGEAFVMACLRPDLFAGVGLNAAPVLGSESSEIHQPNTTSQDAAKLCRSLAGQRAGGLNTQLTSVIVSDQDPIVNPRHSQLNIEAMSEIYGAREEDKVDPADLTGPNTAGKGLILRDTEGRVRISYLINTGLGHAWPAGNAAPAGLSRLLPGVRGGALGGGFINGNSINYPMYLGKFFTENSLRQHSQPASDSMRER